jgi:hypothetical protein
MVEADSAPTFLEAVPFDRTAKFFPWLAAHRDQLRFHELVPERPAPYSTECIARLHSYWFHTAGEWWFMWGGVSLANREIMEVTPTVNLEAPAGQRLVAAAEAEAVPVQKLEGRVVSIANENAARVRASSGEVNLSRVTAEFQGQPGAPEITMNSQAGKVATIEVKPVEGGVRIDVRPDLVEHVREAFDLAERRTVISFEGETARIVRSGDTLVEMRRVESAAMDASDLAMGRDSLGSLRQARAIETDAVFQRMDAHEWQVVEPGGYIRPPRVRFGKAPPPASARVVQVRGIDGVATARMTKGGELYFARPIEGDARAGWHSLADRVDLDPAFRAPIHDTLELSAQAEAKIPGLAADQMARSGRLEEAATMLEHKLPATSVTIEDRVRRALYDIGTRNQAAAKAEIDALRARGLEVSRETRSLLVDGLTNHGQPDVAELLDAELQGEPLPNGLSLVENRGRIKVMYETRHIETVELAHAGPDNLDEFFPPIKYFDQQLLVGREGFEPDFSGSIQRWLHDPELTVREMKVKPFEVAPGVIKDTSTGQQLLRARDASAERFGDLSTRLHRVYVIQPRQSDQRCNHDKPRDDHNCADER